MAIFIIFALAGAYFQAMTYRAGFSWREAVSLLVLAAAGSFLVFGDMHGSEWLYITLSAVTAFASGSLACKTFMALYRRKKEHSPE